MKRIWVLVVLGAVGVGCGGVATTEEEAQIELESFHVESLSSCARTLVSHDDSGWVATIVDNERVHGRLADNAFFRSFGTNQRACIHCHAPSAGWSITPELAQLRFTNPLDVNDSACLLEPTRCRMQRDPRRWGEDPLFRTVDGANAPNLDVSTPRARERAYSLLLTKGLIRVGLPVPTNAEFTLVAVEDPYHYASAAELSLYRRPLPTTNLSARDQGERVATLSSVMWDGRETHPNVDITTDLSIQANDATLGHAQARRDLPPDAQREIVDFEMSLHTAQVRDDRAGDLTSHGAQGGPRWLAEMQPFYPGINDPLTGDSRTGAPFDAASFTIYRAWTGTHNQARARIARGERLFAEKRIEIRGVRGLNDAIGKDVIVGSCSTCHDSPNLGHHSVPLPIDIGIADGARRTPDLPLYTLQNRTTGETVQTTDPGRALVTGKWKDIGKFKGPILRGLAARAPYFHNGSAASIEEVIDFYDERFAVGFTDREKRDLAAFLRSL